MKNIYLFFALFFVFVTSAPRAQTQSRGLGTKLKTQNQKVNPFIGTGGHGHTFPGATMPFGMVQLSPDTRPDPNDWDGCSGYHFSDSLIYGFSHTHLSGTGVSDYCDILVQPVVRDADFSLGKTNASVFSKKTERAEPGFYEVFLEKPRVKVELTASERVGFHRYTFEKNSKKGSIFIDLHWRDVTLDAKFDFSRKKEGIITGHRFSSSWAKDQRVFFFLKFSKTPENAALSTSERIAIFDFDLANQSEIIVECAISSVDVAGAEANWQAETTNFDFEKAKNRAQKTWQKQLSKIEIKGGTTRERTIFYTALYHTMLAPNIFSDVDGRYRGRDQQIHQAQKGATMYTVFSLWDTYRALHPLMTILEPDRVRDFMYTFWRQSEEGGKLPVWELAANETNCMIGNHAIPVIADAFLKGLVPDSLVEPLYRAMKKSATDTVFGLNFYDKLGYIPSDLEPESVSKTLEYSFDDYCVSKMAKKMGRKSDAEFFGLRSENWANLYDPETGFFRPKSNGAFVEPFDPTEVNFNFTEGNAWHFAFLQHHIEEQRSIDQFFEKRLEEFFTTQKQLTGRVQADLTGLIGQFVIGNEPDMHVPFLYGRLGKHEKTQFLVDEIFKKHFTDQPDGLPGNDDCGQMSAWVVFAMLGFYPFDPVDDGIFEAAMPTFPAFKIQKKDGRSTLFLAPQPVKKRQSTRPNDLDAWIPYDKNGFSVSVPLKYASIMLADTLIRDTIWRFGDNSEQHIELGHRNFSKWPYADMNPCWKTQEISQPVVPFLKKGDRVFVDFQNIEIACLESCSKIHYTLDGSEPTEKSPVFEGQNGFFPILDSSKLNPKRFIRIEKTCVLKAIAIENGQKSKTMTAEFTHQADRSKWKITQKNNFNNQYTARGERGLIDGLRGGKDFRSGGYQGFEGENMDATLDFGEIKTVKKLAIGFLQDENSWIFLPKKVIFETSIDGENWSLAGEKLAEHAPTESGIFLQEFSVNFPEISARFVRISAENLGKCPTTHKGAGNDCWIFSDEILVE